MADVLATELFFSFFFLFENVFILMAQNFVLRFRRIVLLVCNNEQSYALVDAEAGILIYFLSWLALENHGGEFVSTGKMEGCYSPGELV
jgi:hypothetical protein